MMEMLENFMKNVVSEYSDSKIGDELVMRLEL